MGDQRQQGTKARVRVLLGLFIHVAVYGLVIAGLLLIYLLASPGYRWFLWLLVGWGIGLAVHALGVVGARLLRGWERRQVRALLDHDGDRPGGKSRGEGWPSLSS